MSCELCHHHVIINELIPVDYRAPAIDFCVLVVIVRSCLLDGRASSFNTNWYYSVQAK
jgi:hypothetical protein